MRAPPITIFPHPKFYVKIATWWKQESVNDLFWTFSRQMTQLGSGEDGRPREGESSFFFGSNKFFKPWLTCFEAEEEEVAEEDFDDAVVEVEEDVVDVEEEVVAEDSGGAVVEVVEEEGLGSAVVEEEEEGTVVESGESMIQFPL